MSYPNNPQRHGGPPPIADQPIHFRYPEAQPTVRGAGFAVNLIVGFIGLACFFLGFAPYTKFSTTSAPLPNAEGASSFFSNSGVAGVAVVSLTLAAGLTALFGLLPNQAANGPTIAGLSLAGLLSLACVMIGLDAAMDVGVGLILVTVGLFLQAARACGALLITAGVLRIGTSVSNSTPPIGGQPPSHYIPGAR